MNTVALTKRSASLVKGATAPVTTVQNGLDRLWAQYIATIKRAESNYFDGARRILATGLGTTLTGVSMPEGEPPASGSDVVEPVTASTAG